MILLTTSRRSSSRSGTSGSTGVHRRSASSELFGSINLFPMTDPYVCHIWFAIDHQYTPNVSIDTIHTDPMATEVTGCRNIMASHRRFILGAVSSRMFDSCSKKPSNFRQWKTPPEKEKKNNFEWENLGKVVQKWPSHFI